MRRRTQSTLSPAALLAFLSIAISGYGIASQESAKATPVKYCQHTELLKLPGGLDDIPTFNSNSPEQVLKPGILLSTFPPEGMKHPEAHLNYSFNGRFDLFSHHVARNETSEEDRTLFLGFIVGNPSNKEVRIQFLSGASYLSQPDAPFVSLPAICENDEGKIFAGPGDRVADDVLRGLKADFLPKCISIDPGKNKLILCLPVPVRHLKPALNGRSTLIRLKSSGPVYMASMAMFAPESEKAGPPESTWLEAFNNEGLCTPRDETPTPPGAAGRVKYGRVAGVAKGSAWLGNFSDAACTQDLHSKDDNEKAPRDLAPADLDHKNSDAKESGEKEIDLLKKNPSESCFYIPEEGKSFTVPMSTVEAGTFGTGQNQAATMIVRYPDTAYLAQGNYGITYKLELPLSNPFKESRNVELLFQSALKSDEHKHGVCFYESALPRAFFEELFALKTTA